MENEKTINKVSENLESKIKRLEVLVNNHKILSGKFSKISEQVKKLESKKENLEESLEINSQLVKKYEALTGKEIKEDFIVKVRKLAKKRPS